VSAQEEGRRTIIACISPICGYCRGRELSAFLRSSARQTVSSIRPLVGTLTYARSASPRATDWAPPNAVDLESRFSKSGVPTFMLKNPSELRETPSLCELGGPYEITNISVERSWRGTGPQLFEHVWRPLADLPVRESLPPLRPAYLTDLTLSPATVSTTISHRHASFRRSRK